MPNRLEKEDSPYLQQHKDNPVDWYPWCDEAFERAKKEHKAIFISIGYSSCHWCHVMEHEVFENEEIAAFLNEHIISIKVDREERPDIDKHYQEVHMLLNRRPGGWPTSIFATPENKPFYAATYIPPHNRDQMLGFSELIRIIAQKIAQNDPDLFKNADEIESFLKPAERPSQATVLKEEIVGTFVKQAEHNYEPAYGGFSEKPKFPQTSTLNTLLNIFLLNGSQKAKKIVENTLENMQLGGMYDLVEGGFCRYSVDEKWLVPHFEKMTYDNALLCELYLRASIHLKNESFLLTAKETADFMLSKMLQDDLFYSASDADTDGMEGKYFIYKADEVTQALKDGGFNVDEIEEILHSLQITPDGNFERQGIIRLASSKRPAWFEKVQNILRSLRESRSYPFIDKKVQVSWNAMMIKSLFMLAATDKKYLDQAKASLDTLLKTMLIGNTLYHSALIGKIPKVTAFLEDYAYLGTALIAAHQCSFDAKYLILAQQLADTALETFYENGRWYFSRGEFVTDADATDSTYPGAVGVIVDLLLSLGSLVDEKYRTYAFKTLEYNSFKMAKTPIYFPYLFNQSLRYIKEDHIVKSKDDNLRQNSITLAEISYPYLLLQPDETVDEFMICGINSCYANVKDAADVDNAIGHI
ncbi:MAG: thioredoxin domain-containing protein [Helicobacteraceae bacterium 4484_230]|nr:MAG: thioredoxin domain-containing protein [Helicobacteraceae bacterium 4484_230]